MNEINIKLFPASYGESILVSCKGENVTNIMIDMGFVSTYTNSIKSELQSLCKKEEHLNLLIITHIDADHISGAIPLLEENKKSDKSNIIKIDKIWFNNLKHLKVNTTDVKLNEKEKLKLKKICSKRYPKELFVSSTQDISCEHGLTLNRLINNGDYKLNEKAIVRTKGNKLEEIKINEEVSMIILSPTEEKLDELIDVWKEELLKIGVKNMIKESEEYDDAFELLLVNTNYVNKKASIKECSSSSINVEELADKKNFTEDKNRINGSSISFILKFYEKKILFLADSHPSVIEEGLNIYRENTSEKIHFDAVKIAHHGSDNNTSPKLLDMINCDKFIISTNGFKFEHPGIATISRIIHSNPKIHKKIILNYEANNIKKYFNNTNLKEKYNYEIIYTNKISTANKKCKVTNIPI